MFCLVSAWAAARRFYERVVALYGAAEHLARRAVLSARERRDLRAWLITLEALARKLLMVEALKLAASRRAETRAHAERKSVAAPPARDPADWRGAFRFSPPAPRGSALCVVPRAAARGAPNLLPLARRLDALARVLAHPQRAVRALARKLGDQIQFAARLLQNNPRLDLSEGECALADAELWRAACADTS